jgi:2,4-dienoyl-CoA reductase-like NADH-dependent reductase (Old Yellow Enzyme family)/thioredoxin reductase
MTVQNRLVMAPMERNYANPDGTVSDRTIAHYGLRAAGGVGWVDVESTFVDPVGRGRTHQLGLHTDDAIPGFTALVEAIHAHGAVAGIELHHAGRNTSSAISGYEPVAPSPVPCPEAGGETPRQLTISEIDAVVARYADAAGRAVLAGFDAVELHSAHGYLPLAFLSPLTNHRSDEYGGSFENRSRFAVRVIEAIRSAIPDGVALGCRFSAGEGLAGGLDLDDAVAYAQVLERAGAQYLSVSSGVYASFTQIIPPMDFESGWLLPTAAAIKRSVTIPVIGASRIVDPVVAERAIADGQVDLIALGRALLTDPELPRKARDGKLDTIVSCIGCNQGCEARISRQLDVTCLVNPTVGRELNFDSGLQVPPRRVVVIGGGPAGLELATTCAERGHDVTMYERESRLGGAIALAAELPDRGGWRTFLEQAERRLRRSGARVRLDHEVDVKMLGLLTADVLVVATGARFRTPAAQARSIRVLTPAELFSAPVPPTSRVVVDGAGAIGLGAAAWLAERGTKVTVVSAESRISDPDGQGGLIARLQETGAVTFAPDREILEAAGTAVTLVRGGAIGKLFAERIEPVSAVVLAAWRESRRELSVLARETLSNCEIYEIGDCMSPRSALEAVYEAAALAHKI